MGPRNDKISKFGVVGFTKVPALGKKQADFWRIDNEHHGDCKSVESFWQGCLHVNDIVHHVVWSAEFLGVDSLFEHCGEPGPDDLVQKIRIYPYPLVWPLPKPWSETMVSIPLWAQKTLEIKGFLGLERPFLDLVSQTPCPRGRGSTLVC